MKRMPIFLILIILLGVLPHLSMQAFEGDGDPTQARSFTESALPTSPIVQEQWLEYWTNYSGGEGGNLRYEITTNTNSTWWEVEVWNQTTYTLNQTAYVKKVSGEGGHAQCYTVEDYAVYTSFGTSHLYQWDKWFDLGGVSIGSTIGPIESAEGDTTILTVNTTETITTPAGTFETWLANESKFDGGFWFYTNYWIDKNSNVTVRATIEIPAFGTILVDELVAASWLTAPVISVVAYEAQRFSANVTWSTDEDANATVYYGTSTGNLNMSASISAFAQDHSVTLLNLLPLTTYYFDVESSDLWGSRSKDNNSGTFYSFTTLSADSPEIISMSANSTSNSTVEIIFDTDKLTNATVWYGPSQPFILSVTDPVFSTNHEMEITGLEELTEYQYIIGVSDSNGNMGNSSLRYISTLDQTAPLVESFLGFVQEDTLNVTVEASEECYVNLYVGQNATHLYMVDHRTPPQSQHSLLAMDLPSYSTVYFKMRLVDPSGNERWYQNGSSPFTRSVPDYLQSEVSHPDDIFLIVGDAIPNITWTASEQTPESYEIFIDGVGQGLQIWDGMDITLMLSKFLLDAGTHTIELVLKDSFGNEASDIVIISITPSSTNTLGTDENFLILGLAAIVIIIILVNIKRRR